jgi:hypothetical protein
MISYNDNTSERVDLHSENIGARAVAQDGDQVVWVAGLDKQLQALAGTV